MDTKDRAQKSLDFHAPTLGVYEHYKGGIYTLYSYSLDEATLKPLYHYYSHEKRTRWTRTAENFTEEVAGKPRFRFLRSATVQELQLTVLGHLAQEREHEDQTDTAGPPRVGPSP